MIADKIISFEKEKERRIIDKCEYSNITIYIKGRSFEDAIYYYFSDYFQEDEILEALIDVIQDLTESLIKECNVMQIVEPTFPLLNREITIHYYTPFSVKNDGIFYYEYEPEELTNKQLIVILNSCIANLRQ